MGLNVTDYKSLSFYDARHLLREWRTKHTRESEVTLEVWENVLGRSQSSLDDELWPILEQVCVAALDCSRQDVAVLCIQQLSEKFKGSNRVRRLQAMQLESLGKWQEAQKMYEILRVEDDKNTPLYEKRLIAIAKSKGNTEEAISLIGEHLKTYLNDVEAWLELSELYFGEKDLLKGIHCLEELMLSHPHNPVYFRRLAEARYTLGGNDNLVAAKKYFQHSLESNPNDLRSSLGLYLTEQQLAGGKQPGSKTPASEPSDALQKCIIILEKAQQHGNAPNHVPIIEALATLG
uniref:ER membrane protein complex subunit 2 n=1 Tax=Rhabditophanes sp. KR3021 TaxID=114890 RepID=A0AC35TXT0_9BILA